ncbi:MAG: hypothetical protein HY801_07275, partial [Candidatus Lindowbacteria bacterium]|nr:hypothetical protein [Candidatus Lindowbacteria bacterium]
WTDNPQYFHPQLSVFVPIEHAYSLDYPVGEKRTSRLRRLEYRLSILALPLTGIKVWARENLRAFAKKSFHVDISLKSANPAGIANKGFVAPEKRERKTAIEAKRSKAEAPVDAVFPMTITDSHPTFRNLRAVARLASSEKPKVLFFVWPLDEERLADRGSAARPAFELSKRLIIDTVESQNIPCQDLSGLLQHEDFFDVNGHCSEDGRRKISEALALQVLEILPKAEK